MFRCRSPVRVPEGLLRTQVGQLLVGAREVLRLLGPLAPRLAGAPAGGRAGIRGRLGTGAAGREPPTTASTAPTPPARTSALCPPPWTRCLSHEVGRYV